MMRTITRVGVALSLALGGSMSTAAAQPNLQPYATAQVFLAQSTTVTVTFLYSLAAANNNLFLFASVGTSGTHLIGVPGAFPAPGTGTPNSVSFAATVGDEVIFGICTDAGFGSPGVCGSPNLTAWYMGPASRNTDNMLHAAILPWAAWNGFAPFTGFVAAAPGTQVIAFEDRTQRNGSDWDYNDLVFSVDGVVVPEPATMVLLATGLIGLSGAGIVRRRRQNRA